MILRYRFKHEKITGLPVIFSCFEKTEREAYKIDPYYIYGAG